MVWQLYNCVTFHVSRPKWEGEVLTPGWASADGGHRRGQLSDLFYSALPQIFVEPTQDALPIIRQFFVRPEPGPVVGFLVFHQHNLFSKPR